jgi:hypothetical protein
MVRLFGGRRRAGSSSSVAREHVDQHLIAHDDAYVHESDDEQRKERKKERKLDGCLPMIKAGVSPKGHPSMDSDRLITFDNTFSKSSPMRPAPPPSVAHATTSSAITAAPIKTSAYSVVAWPGSVRWVRREFIRVFLP